MSARARCTQHIHTRRDLHMLSMLELLHWHLIPMGDAEKQWSFGPKPNSSAIPIVFSGEPVMLFQRGCSQTMPHLWWEPHSQGWNAHHMCLSIVHELSLSHKSILFLYTLGKRSHQVWGGNTSSSLRVSLYMSEVVTRVPCVNSAGISYHLTFPLWKLCCLGNTKTPTEGMELIGEDVCNRLSLSWKDLSLFN